MQKKETPELSNTGLSAKEIAAITACVPCSGTPYIDAIITQGLRFRTATAAMESLIKVFGQEGHEKLIAELAVKQADMLIAAFREPK
jgi:hypothetical protein